MDSSQYRERVGGSRVIDNVVWKKWEQIEELAVVCEAVRQSHPAGFVVICDLGRGP